MKDWVGQRNYDNPLQYQFRQKKNVSRLQTVGCESC
jgi:hypothetical protein